MSLEVLVKSVPYSSELGKNIFAQPKVIKSARSYEPRRVDVYLENLFSDVDQGLAVQCLYKPQKEQLNSASSGFY